MFSRNNILTEMEFLGSLCFSLIHMLRGSVFLAVYGTIPNKPVWISFVLYHSSLSR